MTAVHKKKNIWMISQAQNGMGGAERRMIKVLDGVSERCTNIQFHLVANRELINLMKKDPELAEILERRKVILHARPDWSSFCRWTHSRAKELLHMIRQLKLPGHSVALGMIKAVSWYRWLSRNIPAGDTVHCFAGVPNLTGAVFLAIKDPARNILIEATSPRVSPWIAQVTHTACLGRKRPNLHMRCVSPTVRRHMDDCDGSMLEQEIDLGVYGGPFARQSAPCRKVPRKNIIMFPHRFIPAKNGLLFARIVKKMFVEGSLAGWQVRFRGKGTEEALLKVELSEQIAAGQVDIGFSSHLSDELAESKIAVGLVVTDNYPSQSLFEAMRNGNILLLSRTGDSEQMFNDPHVFFTDLNEVHIKESLKAAVALAGGAEFVEYSDAMRAFFEKTFDGRMYLEEAERIYGWEWNPEKKNADG
jgi:hypothetical protein